MREPLIRPLPVQKIQPRNTALLVIDMERDFVAEGAVQETPGARALIPTINGLSAWARSHGLAARTHLHRRDRARWRRGRGNRPARGKALRRLQLVPGSRTCSGHMLVGSEPRGGEPTRTARYASPSRALSDNPSDVSQLAMSSSTLVSVPQMPPSSSIIFSQARRISGSKQEMASFT